MSQWLTTLNHMIDQSPLLLSLQTRRSTDEGFVIPSIAVRLIVALVPVILTAIVSVGGVWLTMHDDIKEIKSYMKYDAESTRLRMSDTKDFRDTMKYKFDEFDRRLRIDEEKLNGHIPTKK